MSLDLSTQKGFAIATAGLSGASSVLNQLTGLNRDKWDILESGYLSDATVKNNADAKPVLFHIFSTQANFDGAVSQVQDSISRRIVAFEFPYKDGQTTEDLGGSGESYDFDVILFGDNYYQAYLNLMKELNQSTPGTLIHPIRGNLSVRFKDAVVTHKSSERKAVTLHLKFVSHNFEVTFREAQETTKSKLSTAVAFIAEITNVINKIDSNLSLVASARAFISGLLGTYQADYTNALIRINSTFNGGSSTDLPGLLPSAGTTFPVGTTTPDAVDADADSLALATLQAIDLIKELRRLLNELIAAMEAALNGQGGLEFYDDILTLRQSAVAAQQALELGIQSSSATIRTYVCPRLMNLREICFANNLSPDRAYDLEVLNPEILSANYIEEGTQLQVPSQ